MTVLASLLAGLVFGVGLIVSGMADPSKVLGFLDLFGRWDPSLALVMAAAIAVGVIAFAVAGRVVGVQQPDQLALAFPARCRDEAAHCARHRPPSGGR